MANGTLQVSGWFNYIEPVESEARFRPFFLAGPESMKKSVGRREDWLREPWHTRNRYMYMPVCVCLASVPAGCCCFSSRSCLSFSRSCLSFSRSCFSFSRSCFSFSRSCCSFCVLSSAFSPGQTQQVTTYSTSQDVCYLHALICCSTERICCSTE